MSKFFSINGYWKDDKSEFEGYIIKEFDNVEVNEDESIFFYGLSEDDLKNAVASGEDGVLEFVVTSFEEINF